MMHWTVVARWNPAKFREGPTGVITEKQLKCMASMLQLTINGNLWRNFRGPIGIRTFLSSRWRSRQQLPVARILHIALVDCAWSTSQGARISGATPSQFGMHDRYLLDVTSRGAKIAWQYVRTGMCFMGSWCISYIQLFRSLTRQAISSLHNRKDPQSAIRSLKMTFTGLEEDRWYLSLTWLTDAILVDYKVLVLFGRWRCLRI